MKKNLLLSACLSAAPFVFAQNYLPMAQEDAHWIIFAIGENGANHHVISIQGDTIINGVDYKKTWRRNIQSNAISPNSFYPPFQIVYPGSLIGAIRDDSTAKQVYYIQFSPYFNTANDTCDMFDDWLIYDFSQGVGDTIGGCLQFYPNSTHTALSVSTELLWEEDRTVIDYDGSAKLVEGVGTDMGPFWPIYAYPHPAKPSFLYDYCVGEEGYCGLEPASSARQRLADWQIELSPNPATDLLNVRFPEGLHGSFTCTVSDVSGKTVFVKNAEPSRARLQIAVNDLPGGVYVLTVANEEAAVSRRFAKL